jgi:hypothetical protein
MSQPPPFVDFTWSFGDHPFALDSFSRCRIAALFLEYLAAAPFDPAPIDALYVSANGRSGNIGQVLLDPF